MELIMEFVMMLEMCVVSTNAKYVRLFNVFNESILVSLLFFFRQMIYSTEMSGDPFLILFIRKLLPFVVHLTLDYCRRALQRELVCVYVQMRSIRVVSSN